MSNICESVTERIALGEPLGELRDHAVTCVRCSRTMAMPGKIAAATARPGPGLGFAARMTIGAQTKLVVRRRRRIVATAGSSVAAAALAVFVLTRSSTPTEPTKPAPVLEAQPMRVIDDQPAAASDSDLVHLVRLADTKRAARASASWGRIRRPLAPYVQLVKGVAP